MGGRLPVMPLISPPIRFLQNLVAGYTIESRVEKGHPADAQERQLVTEWS